MRWHQLTEDTGLDESNVWEFIEKNCQPYLKQNPDWKTNPLYRGMSYREDIQIKNIRTDRAPTDSTKYFHKLYNEALIENGFGLTRSNSIFCTGSSEMAYKYGEAYVIFPIGNFAFAYSPTIKDLYLFSKTFYQNNFFKFNNADDKVLTASDLTPFVRNRKGVEEHIDKPFSLNDLLEMFKNISYSLGTFLQHIHDPEEFLEKVGFDEVYFTDELGELYENDNLVRAIKTGNEIMVAGGKYLALQRDVFYDMIDKGGEDEVASVDRIR